MNGMEESIMLLLAQAEDGGAGTEGAPADTAPADGDSEGQTGTSEDGSQTGNGEQVPPPKKGFSDMLIPLVLMMVVLYFFMFRGPKKKQAQHKQMLNAMKKNDRVRTIGGIIGTVVDVREDEVVLKIDETSNTKMKFTRGAIATVYSDEETGQK